MAVKVTIWHNPRCSKSRQTLALLRERGVEPEIRRYLDDPPTAAEISGAARALGVPVAQMVRRGEAAFTGLGLSAETPEPDLLAAMAAHPVLIERPIVLAGSAARIGRPPEAVLELL